MKFATKKKFALGLNLKAKAENKNILNVVAKAIEIGQQNSVGKEVNK